MVRLHNNRFLIDVLILTALLRAAQRQRTDALLALEQAVKLAQPSCVLRVFLDAAPALDPLLDGLHLQGSQGEFVQRIRSERAQQHGVRADSRPEQPVLSKPAFLQPKHPDLIELLTQREVEVLQLLALRLTNKEIGQALAISTGTVKQHTRNVFRKLHADNRRDAIVQARNMGFEFDLPHRADQ
jgi:LuxR family maltose regulon positive regulatory protein